MSPLRGRPLCKGTAATCERTKPKTRGPVQSVRLYRPSRAFHLRPGTGREVVMRYSHQHEFTMAVFVRVAAAAVVAGRADAADPPRPHVGPIEDGQFLRPAAATAAEPF